MNLNIKISKKEILGIILTLFWSIGICTGTMKFQYKIAFVTAIAVLTWLLLKNANNIFYNSIYIAILSFISIEICNSNNLESMAADKFLFNICLLMIGYMGMHVIIKNTFYCNIVYMSIWTIIAIAAYYVFEFRQVPLSISNIYQIPTACLVISQYKLEFSYQVMCAGYIFFLCIFFSFINKNKFICKSISKRIILFVVGIFIIIIAFGTPVNKMLNIKTLSWNLQEAYHRNGLVLQCIQNIKLQGIEIPNGFTKDIYNKICKELDENNETLNSVAQKYPNIILIVNESWFDMHQICNYTTEEQEMPFIHSLSNSVTGYAINPNTTTGNSEYEILTSNSLYLRRNTVPFLEGNLSYENSMVKNLKQLGYETSAFHSEPGFSYNRVNTYQTLGFDNRTFLKDERKSFSEDELVRGSISDSTLFGEIIKQYETADANSPQFIYCLTMQNHGGYSLGGVSGLSVYEDFGDYTEELEEYLGLLQYTDKAFGELVRYFEQAEHDTIICMVGDHAPVLASSIYNKDGTTYEKKVAMHSTPVIIWANYPLNVKDSLGHSSMIYLAETLFELAELPMTSYYKYIQDMKEEIPIVHLGYYRGGDGEYYNFEDESPYKEILNNYLYLEYGNIKNIECPINIYNY